MPLFERGTIVRVPFPYTDRETRQHRPALVISDGAIGDRGGLLWVLMITSAANRRWAGDIAILEDFRDCGLPVPSLIRTAKIATIDAAAAEPLGRLNATSLAQVVARVRSNLALAERTQPI